MFPAATAAPFQAAVVKTGFDVMGREGTGYAKVIVVDAVQDLTKAGEGGTQGHSWGGKAVQTPVRVADHEADGGAPPGRKNRGEQKERGGKQDEEQVPQLFEPGALR